MKLLLVEDSMARAMALADALEREGLEVALAPTAGEAARRLIRFRPDALVLNASIPARGASELLRFARAECPRLRVVLIHARDDDGDKFAEFTPDAVFDSVAPQEIVAALRRLLAA